MYETYIHMHYNLHTLFNFEVIPSSYSIDEIIERTSSVPLEYHYSTTIQKTSRKQRARPYLSSTTIVPLFCSEAPLLIQ